LLQPPCTGAGHSGDLSLLHQTKKSNHMETPKLYTLGEEDTAPVVNGVQGTLNTGAFEGDPRGLNSTDLQFLRQNSGQAATGDNSFIAAGENNQVMGHHSACFGLGHYIQGSYAHATGVGHVISGDASAAEGDSNTRAVLAFPSRPKPIPNPDLN